MGKDFFQPPVISLLPKKGELTLLKNWRPVSLLCSDYKVLSKVLANRFKGSQPPIVVSAYADEVNVLVQGQGDIQELEASLAVYEKATTARVNWEKSEACVIGQWDAGRIPCLPGNLTWGIRGLKVLGLHLGSNEIERQNWEGVLGKVQAKLSKWKWLLPQLSYWGRTLIVNNLVAASLWQRLQVLTPPQGLMEQLQRLLVDFFWSGHHWVRASVLYLPVAEGDHGLTDIISRTAAFRLQAAQRLLYGSPRCWSAVARLLLWRAGGLAYDKQLFLMNSPQHKLTGLTHYYTSVIDTWRTLSFTRPPDPTPGMWLFEEPLFDNGFLADLSPNININIGKEQVQGGRYREAGPPDTDFT